MGFGWCCSATQVADDDQQAGAIHHAPMQLCSSEVASVHSALRATALPTLKSVDSKAESTDQQCAESMPSVSQKRVQIKQTAMSRKEVMALKEAKLEAKRASEGQYDNNWSIRSDRPGSSSYTSRQSNSGTGASLRPISASHRRPPSGHLPAIGRQAYSTSGSVWAPTQDQHSMLRPGSPLGFQPRQAKSMSGNECGIRGQPTGFAANRGRPKSSSGVNEQRSPLEPLTSVEHLTPSTFHSPSQSVSDTVDVGMTPSNDVRQQTDFMLANNSRDTYQTAVSDSVQWSAKQLSMQLYPIQSESQQMLPGMAEPASHNCDVTSPTSYPEDDNDSSDSNLQASKACLLNTGGSNRSSKQVLRGPSRLKVSRVNSFSSQFSPSLAEVYPACGDITELFSPTATLMTQLTERKSPDASSLLPVPRWLPTSKPSTSSVTFTDSTTVHGSNTQVTSPSHVTAVLSSPIPALSTSYRLAGRSHPDGSSSPRLGSASVSSTAQ